MQQTERTSRAGYLYVLTHPSDSRVYKIGMTTRHPEIRLEEHNSRHEEYAGKLVKVTGQKWVLQTYLPVPDTYWAEAIFWAATGLADIPYRRGIEVEHMDAKAVEAGLEAVKRAGVRPPPPPLDDHVYAFRAWINKRLAGRGITLVGHVRSKYGKSKFRCDQGHEWRATPNDVAEGLGCPQCGAGERTPEAIRQAINVGTLCLLVHPGRPGQIKIGLTYGGPDQSSEVLGEWQIHRYRNVEEPKLALSLFWDELGLSPQDLGEPISIDLGVAEEAIRSLHFRLVSAIALVEKAKEVAAPNG